MNLRTTTSSDFSSQWIGMAVVWLLLSGTADAQRLLMLVGRDTGSVEVTNAGSGAVGVDSYSITSPSGLLNEEAWSSLTDQGVPGFREANPHSEKLTELALPPTSATLDSGESISLGNAYRGGSLIPSQEDVAFQFTVPTGGVVDGTVKYVGASQTPTITVDRATGNITLTNPAAFELDGYTIASPTGLLNPSGFAGLASQNMGTWAQADPSEHFISELNFEGAQAFEANTTFDLGTAYDVSAGVPRRDEDLTFSYTTAEGVREGAVEFVGPISDLVLQVDSISGEASIQNLSSNAGSFDIVGYNISSSSGSLSVEAWTSFTDTGSAGAGWQEANPRPEELAELNLTGSKVFDSGTSISLGRILAGGEDLVFEYATSDAAVLGSVEYILDLGGGEPLDRNNDRLIDLADADLACAAADDAALNAILSANDTIRGDVDFVEDGDGNKGVQFDDFLALVASFGIEGSLYSQGNIDCSADGTQFDDFLALLEVFGTTVPAGAAAGSAAQVPEPASAGLVVLGAWCLFGIRKRRHALAAVAS